ncbi:MAG: hypothetical protein P4L16_00335 [Chlamydiales bacterium]|nr:hypothetical protein [Chlamydiales bacterium]
MSSPIALSPNSPCVSPSTAHSPTSPSSNSPIKKSDSASEGLFKRVSRVFWSAVQSTKNAIHTIHSHLEAETLLETEGHLPSSKPLEPLKDDAIMNACTVSKEKILKLTNGIPPAIRSNLEAASIHEMNPEEPTSPRSIEAHKKLVKQEYSQRKKLVHNLIHFTTISVFNQKIFGCKTSNPLEFYKKLTSKMTSVEIEENDKEALSIQKARDALKDLPPNELNSSEINKKILTLDKRAEKIIGPCLKAYYEELIAHPEIPINPMKAYYCYIADESTAYYYLARIFMPIIKWFITLILHPEANANSGINHAKNTLFEYFQAKQSVRNDIFGLFNEASDYFDAMLKYHVEYNDIQDTMHPLRVQHPKYATGSLKDHLATRLKKDLKEKTKILAKDAKERTDLKGSDYLNHKFNLFIQKLINIKSGIPLIGGVLDRILKMILGLIIQDLNIIPSALNKTFSHHGLNLTLTYNIKKMLVDKLKALEEKLTAPDTLLPQPQKNDTTFVQDPLFENEKIILQMFTKNLLNYLPLIPVTSDTLHKTLTERLIIPFTRTGATFDVAVRKIAPAFVGLLKKMGATEYAKMVKEGSKELDIDCKVEEALTDIMLSVGESLVNPCLMGDSSLNAWTQTLERINEVFDLSDSNQRTDDDLHEINRQLSVTLDSLTKIALKKKFTELPPIAKRRERVRKVNQLIHNAKIHTSLYSSALKNIHDQISTETANRQIDNVEENSFRLIISLNAYLEKLRQSLDDILKCKRNNRAGNTRDYLLVGKDREQLKIKVQEILKQIDLIRKEYKNLKSTIAITKVHGALKSAIPANLNLADDSPNNTATILQRYSKFDFEQSTNRLQTNLLGLFETQRSNLQPCIKAQEDIVQNIDQINKEMILRDAQSAFFKELLIDIKNVKDRNYLLLQRPRRAILSTLKEKLTSMKKQFEELAKPSPVLTTPSERIQNLSSLFNEIQRDLVAYTDLIKEENKPPKDSLKLIFSHITALLELQQPNTILQNEAKLLSNIHAYQKNHSSSFINATNKLSKAFDVFSIEDRRDCNELANMLPAISRNLAKLPSQSLLKEPSIIQAETTASYTKLINALEACTIGNEQNNPAEVNTQIEHLKMLLEDEKQFNTDRMELIRANKLQQQKQLKENLSQMTSLTGKWIEDDWQYIEKINTLLDKSTHEINHVKDQFPVAQLASWSGPTNNLSTQIGMTASISIEVQQRVVALIDNLTNMLLENNRTFFEQIFMRGVLSRIAKVTRYT